MRGYCLAGALLALLLGSERAQAQDAAPEGTADRATAAAVDPPATAPEQAPPGKDQWEFIATGYLWLAGTKGTADVIKQVAPVDFDLSFGDVLKALQFAVMGAAEAKKNRVVSLGDFAFFHLAFHKGIGIRDPDFAKANLDLRTAEVTLLGGYRVVNDEPVSVDLLAGGRLNSFKVAMQLQGPDREADGTIQRTWVDPIIAARVIVPLSEKWRLSLYGDVGGFGLGSHITWQAAPTINWAISRKTSIGAGWRYLKVDYRNGDVLYDVGLSGPVIDFQTAL